MNIKEFKGIYYNEHKQQQFFEGGAHFSYKELYQILDTLQRLKRQSECPREKSQPKPKTRNAKSTNDYQPEDSHNAHVQTFDLPKHSNLSSTFQLSKQMNLSMYNNVYMKRSSIKDEETAIPRKQISIIKSTHSNTRNSNNCYENDNSTAANAYLINQGLSMSVKDLKYGRYSMKDRKIIVPSKALVEQIMGNSKGMVQFTSRIKENLISKPKGVPYEIQRNKQYLKQISQRNKVTSTDFDQICLYKKQDETKSKNDYTQRDFNKLSKGNNINSSLRGISVEKPPDGKTINNPLSRNKIGSLATMEKQKPFVCTTYKNCKCKEMRNINEVTLKCRKSLIAPMKDNNNNRKSIKMTQLAYSNYAQKYMKKILMNSFDRTKRLQSSNKPNH